MLGHVHLVTAEPLVVRQHRPGQRIVVAADSQEAAEAQNGRQSTFRGLWHRGSGRRHRAVALVPVYFVVRFIYRRARARRAQQSLLRKADNVVEEKLAPLVTKRAQLVQPDPYG
jgi:hypothetical protein